MDVCQNVLVVAMADRHVWIFDTRRMGQPLQRRESSLKYMTRCVRAFPSGEGYVCTSVEGRVAVDFVDASDEAQEQKYAFKCHRSAITDQENMENVYPVNAAAFHPTYYKIMYTIRLLHDLVMELLLLAVPIVWSISGIVSIGRGSDSSPSITLRYRHFHSIVMVNYWPSLHRTGMRKGRKIIIQIRFSCGQLKIQTLNLNHYKLFFSTIFKCIKSL